MRIFDTQEGVTELVKSLVDLQLGFGFFLVTDQAKYTLS